MKRVIVLGASRGIGAELVKQFSELGHEVLALSRSIERMDELFGDVSGVSLAKIDLESHDFKQEFSRVAREFGKIDAFVLNAGVLVNKPFEELTEGDFNQCYRVNVIAPMMAVQAILPYLNPDAHIVNISSVGGIQGSVKFPGLTAYSTSKAALVSFTELFSEEFKEENVAMNCLALGAVQTEMLEEAFPGYKAPLSPEEMGGYIVDFTLTAHKFMKGKVIPVSLSTP